MTASTAALTEEAIRRHLSTHLLGRQIHLYPRVSSTNDVALRLAARGHPEGTVVVAEEQTQGRGRHGRAWHSQAGVGLWFSILLRPRGHARLGWLLSLAASLSVAVVLRRHFDVEARTKWPNDVIVGGRKIAGVLVEGQVTGHRQSYAVVGVGINVNHQREDFPPALQAKATSLRIASGGREANRSQVLARVLESFEEIYASTMDDQQHLLERWLLHCAHLKRLVSVATAQGPVTGRFLGIHTDGKLILQSATGEQISLVARDLEILEEQDVLSH